MFGLLFVFIGVVKHAEHAGFTQVRLGVFMYMRSQAGNIRRCAGVRIDGHIGIVHIYRLGYVQNKDWAAPQSAGTSVKLAP